ncbi:TPA: hypothetical protein ACPSKE_002852 [Legionella feeleii]
MTSVSVRLSEEDLSYLESLANNKILFPRNKKNSSGKTLKALIQWCRENDFEPTNTPLNLPDDSKKMLEQIHVTLPHLLYLTRLHILMDSRNISDEVVANSKQQAVDYLNKVCGDLQNMLYTEIQWSTNDVGLKQIPIEADLSQWKTNK